MIEGKAKEPEGKLRPIADTKGNEPNHNSNDEQQADKIADTTHGILLTGCAGHAPATDGHERKTPKQCNGPGSPYIPYYISGSSRSGHFCLLACHTWVTGVVL